jgi:hypothetical protein
MRIHSASSSLATIKTSLFLVGLAAALAVTPARASITNVTCASEGEVWAVYTYDQYDHLSFYAHQYDGAARMTGSIFTDSAVDPTLIINATIDNDTSFPWTGYHINVFMNQMFSISSPTVLNPGWTANITSQPLWNGANYAGQVDYYGGNPVGIGQILSFGYRITFDGALQYNFGQELMPVPEPGSAGLFVAGALLFAGRRRFCRS